MSRSKSSSKQKRKSNQLTSVGIDIGTTSTHLVFSELILGNSAGATQIPSLKIQERRVIFEGDIHFTPLRKNGSIDGAGVKKILRGEYRKAGIKPKEIDCGAVIITGETARMRNAREVLEEVSDMAGDFVAASAGPNLESVLAARGSGAVQHSLETGRTICNIDIGGGTTNIAIYRAGELIDTGCLLIGGRCLRFSHDGRLTSQSEAGQFLYRKFVELQFDPNIARHEAHSMQEFEELGHTIAEEVFKFTRRQRCEIEPLFMTNPITTDEHINEFWFSGGVAELMRAPDTKPFLYGDFGWFLARGLERSIASRQLQIVLPEKPIRATVLGAGSHSVQLSGNTVSVDFDSLPVRGVPLIRPFANMVDVTVESVTERLRSMLSVYAIVEETDSARSYTPVAVVLEGSDNLRYADLKSWAASLGPALLNCQLPEPYILITGGDSAMALGQLMKGELKNKKLIVLDGLDLTIADYIDIGKPIGTGTTIPVTLKSLIFANEGR